MKVVYFGNNDVAVEVLEFLVSEGHEIVGLVVHPEGREKRAHDLIDISGVAPSRVFTADVLKTRSARDRLASLEPEIGVSAFFGYILRRRVLDLFELGCVNIHPALLPYNRGSFPNVWSIVENTPAGATLHLMDSGVDTGRIIAQKQIPVRSWDTGKTLYRKLERVCVELFAAAFPRFISGELTPREQVGEGTYHRKADVVAIDEIDLDREYTAQALIDVLRARTFPPYPGAYFLDNGKKVYLELALIPDFEVPEEER